MADTDDPLPKALPYALFTNESLPNTLDPRPDPIDPTPKTSAASPDAVVPLLPIAIVLTPDAVVCAPIAIESWFVADVSVPIEMESPEPVGEEAFALMPIATDDVVPGAALLAGPVLFGLKPLLSAWKVPKLSAKA